MATASASRKRKREDDRMLLGEPFIIDAHVSSIFDVPTRVSPAVVLPRSFIPLQWLAGVPSRLFRSWTDLPVLNVPGNVLIVKAEGERQMSAVEKLSNGIYMLYRMSPQLKMKDVRKIAAVAKKALQAPALTLSSQPPGQHDALTSDWWSTSRVPGYEFPNISRNTPIESGALELEESENVQDTTSVPTSSELPLSITATATQDPYTRLPDADVLEQVRYQYYETLFISRTSLAYFAKSTLTRARVTFEEQDIEATEALMATLIDFLKRMILPLDKMDMKYQKSLFDFAMGDQEDSNCVIESIEATYVARWKSLTFGDRLLPSTDQRVKKEIYDLKIRETKLQIIILLEILSLEKQTPLSNRPAKDTALRAGGRRVKRKKAMKKEAKIIDPSLLLDLLVDRLCIWRSIGEEMVSLDDKAANNRESSRAIENNHLRNFCVEIILPFYASKLPDRCTIINKKFGGPSGSNKHRSNSIKRPKTTQHDATLPSPHHKPPATDGDKPGPVSVFASANVPPKTTRGGTLNSKSFAKRVVEVDAKVELQNAIKALTKPNRAALASEFVEDAEKRLSRIVNKGACKPSKAVPNSVQVMATPKKRKASIPSIGPTLSRLPTLPTHVEESVTDTPTKASSLALVPESSPFRPQSDHPARS